MRSHPWAAFGGSALDRVADESVIKRVVEAAGVGSGVGSGDSGGFVGGIESAGGGAARVARGDSHELDPLQASASESPRVLRTDRLMTRGEVAGYLRVSARTVQRMEKSRTLQRCSGMGMRVRFNPRDVLRLASASRKER